jgi:hypothetical protein
MRATNQAASMTVRHLLAVVATLFCVAVAAPSSAQTPAEIAAVQDYLASLGYEPGPADGMMGERTREAIRAFEASQGQPVTGEPGDWLIALATGLAADPGITAPTTAELAEETGLLIVPETSTTASPISELSGDPGDIHGLGSLAFNDLDDGGILVTDGIPWRGSVHVAPRTLTIISTTGALYSVSPADFMPVPLDGQVVDIPGSLFVPLFLASETASAALATLADAVGVTWRFQEAGVRLELDGFALEAAEPGATMTFTAEGVELHGFTLLPL